MFTWLREPHGNNIDVIISKKHLMQKQQISLSDPSPISDVRPKEIQINLYFNKILLEGDRCKNIDDRLKCEALYKPV